MTRQETDQSEADELRRLLRGEQQTSRELQVDNDRMRQWAKELLEDLRKHGHSAGCQCRTCPGLRRILGAGKD